MGDGAINIDTSLDGQSVMTVVNVGDTSAVRATMAKESKESLADEKKESAVKQKAEMRAGTEKHKGIALKVMKMFRGQQK